MGVSVCNGDYFNELHEPAEAQLRVCSDLGKVAVPQLGHNSASTRRCRLHVAAPPVGRRIHGEDLLRGLHLRAGSYLPLAGLGEEEVPYLSRVQQGGYLLLQLPPAVFAEAEAESSREQSKVEPHWYHPAGLLSHGEQLDYPFQDRRHLVVDACSFGCGALFSGVLPELVGPLGDHPFAGVEDDERAHILLLHALPP